MVVLALLVAVVGVSNSSPATAQGSDDQSITVAYIPISPFAQLDEQGQRSGFLIDLAEEIGREISVDIEFLDVADSQEFVGRQVSGETQMIAGVARLPPLQETNVFSDPVATETLRLVVLTENLDPGSAEPRGRRIGIVPPAVGSQVEELLAVNEVLEFATPEQAMMELLSGDVDALLLPNPAAVSLSRAAGVDDRISFVGPVLREVERVVALHESRADLLPAVNRAIAALENDGRLDALRRRYFIETPASAPDVLTVGVAHSPPFAVIADDGSVSGFAVDVFRDLADRASLDYRFLQLPLDEYFTAAAGRVDVLPSALSSSELRSEMDVTLPIGVDFLAAYVRAGATFGGWDDLIGRRVAATTDVASVLADAGFALDDISVIDDDDALIRALAGGDIDALFGDAEVIEAAADRAGLQGDIALLDEAALELDSVIALRFGLGAERERLNTAIPVYLLSDDFDDLQTEYFGDPVFWTSRRVSTALGAVGAIALVLIGVVVAQSLRRRRETILRQEEDLAREVAHSESLSELVRELETTNQEQVEFAYSVSHDLKAPTNTMGLLIDELAEFGAVGEGGEEVLVDMRSTNHRMSRMVDDVLAYSVVVGEEPVREVTDLNAVVDDVVSDLASDIEQAGATVTRDNLPSLSGHPAQLRSLFQNLVSNAIKFRSPDRAPVVHVSSTRSSGRLRVSVSDNGIGIPEEQSERVFGMFKRLHAGASIAGTGLGLAICRRVMSNHGGAIEVRPGVETGTTLDLTFGGT